MTRRGGGSIIIIASIFGREAGGRMTYNAVKAAEISLATSLAQQLAPVNIRVNSVSPGSFLFEGGSWWKRQQENPAAIAEYVKRELPFGRFGRADELGDVVAFLASSRASWISGTSIVVDGCQIRAGRSEPQYQRASEPLPDIHRYSHARAACHSRVTVARDRESAVATSCSDRPPKYLSSTICAWRASILASSLKAWSSIRTSMSGGGTVAT
jgi:hypothetical protein